MKAKFEKVPHFLLTRFNIATPGRESDFRNRPGWLEERFALFERFCLPSVAAQDSRDFYWIILFDVHTPDLYKSRIEQLREVFDFLPIFVSEVEDIDWWQIIVSNFGIVSPILLTTRLDNDDALAADFVSRTRSAFFESSASLPFGIIFANGLVMSPHALYRLSHTRNAFLSWVENVESERQVVTAAGIRHMEAANYGELCIDYGGAAWLQIVHGSNVSNRPRGWRISPDHVYDKFDRSFFTDVSRRRGPFLLDNCFLFPVRLVRDFLSSQVQRFLRFLRRV